MPPKALHSLPSCNTQLPAYNMDAHQVCDSSAHILSSVIQTALDRPARLQPRTVRGARVQAVAVSWRWVPFQTCKGCRAEHLPSGRSRSRVGRCRAAPAPLAARRPTLSFPSRAA